MKGLNRAHRSILNLLLCHDVVRFGAIEAIRFDSVNEPSTRESSKVRVSQIRKWAKAVGAPAAFKIVSLRSEGYTAQGRKEMKHWLSRGDKSA